MGWQSDDLTVLTEDTCLVSSRLSTPRTGPWVPLRSSSPSRLAKAGSGGGLRLSAQQTDKPLLLMSPGQGKCPGQAQRLCGSPQEQGSRERKYQITYFKKIFLMWTIFKVFIECVTILLLFYGLAFWLRGMWDLRSLTRDRTYTGR